MFFVDLPDAIERAQIWDIVIARHGRKAKDFDTVALARACEQFTGAEIESVFIDAMHEAYAEGKEPGAKDILTAMPHTVPLAQLMDGQIAALRHWAKGRAREAAGRPRHTSNRSPHPPHQQRQRKLKRHLIAAAIRNAGCGGDVG
jgi:SpoVK/Ycf46/Vps4 family AAA+-type ATPase